MVEDTGAAAGAGGLRKLNEAQPAAIEATPGGEPKAMLFKGVFRHVVAIHDSWRIDDEWWRDEIARRYFEIELEGGRRLTVYHDLSADAWYAQSYTGPRELAAKVRGRGRRAG